MLEPLTQEIIFENVFYTYHPTLERILQEIIQPNEPVFLAATASRTIEVREDYGKRKRTRSSRSCLILITSHRWIRAGMNWYGMADSFPYRKYGSRFSSWIGGGEYFENLWVPPPKRLPNEKEIGNKTLRERIEEHVHTVSLKKLPEVRNKNRYLVEHNQQQFEIVELVSDDSWIAFFARDGEQTYLLLQIARQNDGCIPYPHQVAPEAVVTTDSNLTEELERLSQLRKQGLLTEEEFRAAKRKLLEL